MHLLTKYLNAVCVLLQRKIPWLKNKDKLSLNVFYNLHDHRLDGSNKGERTLWELRVFSLGTQYELFTVQYGSAEKEGERVAKRNYSFTQSKTNSLLSTHLNNKNGPLHWEVRCLFLFHVQRGLHQHFRTVKCLSLLDRDKLSVGLFAKDPSTTLSMINVTCLLR